MHGRSRFPLIAAFDLICCLMIYFLLQANPQVKPYVPTFGQFAVTATWLPGSNDDVDLYVRDPSGNICFYVNRSVGFMNLEHDDLGTFTSGTQTLPTGQKVKVLYNGERTVIRGIIPGEYTVNAHMYLKNDRGPTKVLVQLWSLRGSDTVVTSKTVTLTVTAQEITAFRFTLNAAGQVSNVNHLQRPLVDESVSQTPPSNTAPPTSGPAGVRGGF